jgi:hypothetical protein
LDGYEDD